MKEWDHLTSCSVDQVIGAFFLVRKELFTKLDGFDERFFMYYEEVDFSLRAKRNGWNSYYYNCAQAFHKGGGVSRQVKSFRLFYTLRSRIQYALKNFTLWPSVITVIVTLLIEPFARFIYALFKLSLSSLSEILKAYFLLYKWLFSKILSNYFH